MQTPSQFPCPSHHSDFNMSKTCEILKMCLFATVNYHVLAGYFQGINTWKLKHNKRRLRNHALWLNNQGKHYILRGISFHSQPDQMSIKLVCGLAQGAFAHCSVTTITHIIAGLMT